MTTSPKRWHSLWERLGASKEPLAHDVLLAAWTDRGLPYHNAKHLDDCLRLFDEHAGLARRPDEVELAIYFHDAVYDPRRSGNEQKSAGWARRAVADAGLAVDLGQRVEALILATCHDAVPEDGDERLLVDVDLAVLGRSPEAFDRYEEAVRQEYRWVPGFLYRRKRREILTSFLERPSIYATVPFREIYEEQARANLRRSIARLA